MALGRRGLTPAQRKEQKGSKGLSAEIKRRQDLGLSPASVSAPTPCATPAPTWYTSLTPQLPHLAAASLSQRVSAGVSALCH